MGATLPGNPDVNLPSLANTFAALPHTDPAADANAMLAAAQALPDVKDAGLSDDFTVWLQYKDGTGQVIITAPRDEEDEVVPEGSAPSLQHIAAKKQTLRNAKDATRPDGHKAFVYSALTKDFTGLQISDPVTMISGFLTTQGYDVASTDSANYNMLREVQNASVFYIDTHGGVGLIHDSDNGLDTRVFTIATPTPVSDSAIANNIEAIKSGEMTYISVAEWFERVPGLPQLRLSSFLAITPIFVRNHMSFARNSFVFINGCGLMQAIPEAQAFITILQAKGAAHVLGWTELVGAKMAADSGVFLFDRLLGTDGYAAYPGDPANRPFNLAEVMADMATKERQPAAQPPLIPGVIPPYKLDKSNIWSVGAALVLKNDPAAPTLALAPTISSVNVHNDRDSITLYGDFGSPAQTPQVMIGGTQVDAISSSGQITVTNLPRTGDGSGGPIQVIVDGAKSNPVMLNQWNDVPVVMTTYNGNWVRTVTCSMNFRGVFDALRTAPDTTPYTSGVSNDETVVQNGSCSFVSVNPGLSGALPWWDFNNQPTMPQSGVKANGPSNDDGLGGGKISLSLQAFFDNGTISFLDTSAAAGNEAIVIDPVTQNLAGGTVTQASAPNQILDTLKWSATSSRFPPDSKRSR